MDSFNILVPPDEDFPEVVVAKRMGEGFEREYVEYEPRWRFDRRRRAVVADEKFFYAMADTAERLKAENAKLRELVASLTDRSIRIADKMDCLEAENRKLRELVRGLHMAYIGIIDQCESFDSSLTWEFSGDVDADLAKQHASYEQDRHRFDVAMRELGMEVDG